MDGARLIHRCRVSIVPAGGGCYHEADQQGDSHQVQNVAGRAWVTRLIFNAPPFA